MSERRAQVTSGETDLVAIRIIDLPVAVYLKASEHGDELMREFALIAAGTVAAGTVAAGTVAAGPGDDRPAGHLAEVPARLTALVEELRARFSGFTLQPESELAAAAARGDAVVDVVYTLPPAAAPAAADLDVLLDEADEFCRSGDLLTLATPPDALAFRRWFLGEFVRQAAGEPPTPWPEWKP